MAVTAVLAVDDASRSSGQLANFVLTLSNSGGSDVEVEAFSANGQPSSACNISGLSFYPSTNRTIAAAGTLIASFSAVFFTNVRQDDADTEDTTQTVVASVTLDDGSTVASNVVTMTVSPLETSEAAPAVGQLDFRTNNNSDLLAVI